MTPAAQRIGRALAERGPMPLVDLATTVGMRKSCVRAELEADPAHFIHNGRSRRGSRWSVRGFDAADAAAHWGVSVELAQEFLTGDGGFAELGFVTSLNGRGGPFVVTTAGHAISHDLSWLEPESEIRQPPTGSATSTLSEASREGNERAAGVACAMRASPALPLLPARGGVPAKGGPHG